MTEAPSGPGREDTTEKDYHRSPWRALKHRNYRLLWMGNGFSHLGDYMQQVAQGWLVWEITGSVTALSLAAFVGVIPRVIIGAFGGPFVDNNDRRKVLAWTQTLALIFAMAFAALAQLGLVQLWLALLFIFILEATHILNQMCRQALLPEIVPRHDIAGAVSINSTGNNLARIAGPALGGMLIPLLGAAGLMFINSLTFLGMLVSLWLMNIPAGKPDSSNTDFAANLRTGYLLIWQNSKLKILLYLALISALLIIPFISLLPAYVERILAKGATFYGFLISFYGIGGVIGALGAAVIRRRLGKWTMVVAAIGQGLLLMIFAFSKQSWVALTVILLLGLFTIIYNTGIVTEIQLNTPREFLGRIMGMYQLNKSVTSLGALAQGFLSKWLGVSVVFALFGALYLLTGAGVQGWIQLRVTELKNFSQQKI